MIDVQHQSPTRTATLRLIAVGATLACAFTGALTSGPVTMSGLGTHSGTVRTVAADHVPGEGFGECGHCWHPG